MERMAVDPTASVPQACHGWGETIAAYRFFDNEKVQWHAILEPHWQQTQKRMQTHQVVLCLQDTTELDFNGQDALGFLSSGRTGTCARESERPSMPWRRVASSGFRLRAQAGMPTGPRNCHNGRSWCARRSKNPTFPRSTGFPNCRSPREYCGRRNWRNSKSSTSFSLSVVTSSR